MPSGLADIEGVQGDQVAGAGGEVAEPERPILGRRGHDAGGGRGELGQGSDPLGPTAEPVATQELLHPRRRPTHPTIGEVADQLAGAQVGRATAAASTASTWSGGVAVGITGGRRSLGSSAANP
jgi:hypothetical protein